MQVHSHNSSLPEIGPEEHPKKTDILVIDDDTDLLDVTRFVLENEGFGVETARSSEDALEMLRAGELPGLVLLDLMMPVMNGWEFLEEVAKLPALKAIPIVVLTASETREVPGAVEVQRKPITLGSLIEMVERHARRSA
jgi:CheY-like chemotaxis protein